ncbi:MAG: serine/threonine protein kinase [Polyangiaceae bacterium]
MPNANDETKGTDEAAGLKEPQAPETQREGRALSHLRPGTIVEGKYLVDRIIGRGGMGVVVSATHVELNKRVALKFLDVKDEDGAPETDFYARFALEARVCAKLKNDHIARVNDVSVWQGKYPFMVMEFLEGEDLRHRHKAGGKIPLGQAVDYAVQICEGLAEAHKHGIVHRDLKPPNLFITRRHDGSELVKVLDFGISKWASDGVGELTKTGVMLGSPKYMSPEQLNGTPIDSRSDVWSLGAILYWMLTGRAPYNFPQVTQTFMAIASGARPTPPSALEPSIPPEVDDVILRCLTKDRDQRIQNVAELAGELLEAVGSPFAKQSREHIASVLDLAGSAPPGALSAITTGSHVAFALPSNRLSIPNFLGGEAPTVVPPPQESATPPPMSARAHHGVKSWWGLAGIAAVVVTIVAVGARAPATSATTALDSARVRSFEPKQLSKEPATLLVAPPQPVSPVEPTPAFAVVAAPAIKGAQKPTSDAPPPPSHAEALAADPPAAPVAPPPAHSAHPQSAAARAARAAAALDDRQ